MLSSVPCDNGILVAGRTITASRCPGVLFRVCELVFRDDAASLTAEDIADTRFKIVTPATMCVLADPVERIQFLERRPRCGGQAVRFWSFCQLKVY
jgi:hypothetical protein